MVKLCKGDQTSERGAFERSLLWKKFQHELYIFFDILYSWDIWESQARCHHCVAAIPCVIGSHEDKQALTLITPGPTSAITSLDTLSMQGLSMRVRIASESQPQLLADYL